ncbi:hypothetical protein FGB62_139g220 [Gracilaria domingensis]|nr:hypothetical protein FGB62_139g220 [Gracilaria domingensis]
MTPKVPLTILVLLVCICDAKRGLKQQNPASSQPLSYTKVRNLLNSDDISCRKADENISKLCHTSKLRDRVKLASLITTCIEKSLNTHGQSETSTWNDLSGLQKVASAHIEILLSTSLPFMKSLCENTKVASTNLVVEDYFLNEETISNSSSNVMLTAKLLRSCEPIAELSSSKDVFDGFATLLESVIPFIGEGSKASKAHWKAFEMFTARTRSKFRFFQSRIESQIGEVETMMKTLKSASLNHRKSLSAMRPYLNDFGNIVDIEMSLRKLQREIMLHHRANRICYQEWLSRRGTEPQKCFLHSRKASKSPKPKREKYRDNYGGSKMLGMRRKCKEGDQLLLLLRIAKRFSLVKFSRWVDFDTHVSARRTHKRAIVLHRVRKELKSDLRCVYIHSRGVLTCLLVVSMLCSYTFRRMYVLKKELKAHTNGVTDMLRKEFRREQEAKRKDENANQLYDISQRINELMTMCDYFDVLLQSCSAFCKEIEGAMNAGMSVVSDESK